MRFRSFFRSSLLTATLLVVPGVTAAAQTLIEKTFGAKAEAEGVLELRASAPGATWLEKEREAATAQTHEHTIQRKRGKR